MKGDSLNSYQSLVWFCLVELKNFQMTKQFQGVTGCKIKNLNSVLLNEFLDLLYFGDIVFPSV